MPDPTTTDKPKRARKPKRKAPDPTTPKKPRVTLLSRIEAMGPTHLAAYRTLANGNAAFVREVAAALGAAGDLARARNAVTDLTERLRCAEVIQRRAVERETAGRAVLAKLDTLARQIAAARGDVPTDDATAPTVAPASDED